MATVPCPSCQEPLPDGGASACPHCHLPLTGPLAVRLWQVDQSIATLRDERERLLTALREHPTAREGPGVAGTAAVGAATGWPRVHPTPRRPRWSGQQALLAVGVLLLLVAAVIFLAVAWDRIGVLGQVASMGVLTAATGYGALWLSRRGLDSSAEAVGALTAGLLLLDVAAARTLGLGTLESVDGRSYATGAGLTIAVALAALHVRDRAIAAFAVGSLAAACWAWSGVLGWATDTSAAIAAVALAGALLFAAAAVWLPRRLALVRQGAVVPAVLWLVLSLAAALSGVLIDEVPGDGLTAEEGAAIVVLAVIAVGGYVTLRRLVAHLPAEGGAVPVVGAGGQTADNADQIRSGPDWRAHPLSLRWLPAGVLASAVTLAGPTAVAGVGWQAGGPAAAVSAVALALVVGALVWLRPLGNTVTAAWFESMGGLALVGTVASAVRADSTFAECVTLAAVAATATVVAIRLPALRVAASAVGVLAAAGSLGLGGDLVSDGARVTGLAVAAVTAAALAAHRRGQAEEAALGASAVAVFGLAQASAQAEAWPYAVAALCGLEGLIAALYAMLRGRRTVVVIAVLAWTAMVWTLLAEARVDTLEAYTLPLAALTLAAGLWLRRPAGLSSWLSVGPAAAIALLPSALAAMDDPGLARPLLTVVAGAAVLALGVALRWQALVVIGALATALVAVGQLAPYALGAPRWITLGVTGAVLLALGARYERRRRDAQRMVHWLATLH